MSAFFLFCFCLITNCIFTRKVEEKTDNSFVIEIARGDVDVTSREHYLTDYAFKKYPIEEIFEKAIKKILYGKISNISNIKITIKEVYVEDFRPSLGLKEHLIPRYYNIHYKPVLRAEYSIIKKNSLEKNIEKYNFKIENIEYRFPVPTTMAILTSFWLPYAIAPEPYKWLAGTISFFSVVLIPSYVLGDFSLYDSIIGKGHKVIFEYIAQLLAEDIEKNILKLETPQNSIPEGH